MNEKIESFAREEIKKGLAELPEKNQRFFKQMYSHDDMDMDINDVVDAMPAEKLDWAMQQVERTINR